MVYYFVHTDNYLVIDTKELQEFVKNNMQRYTVKSANTYGYDGNVLYTSYGVLVPIEDIMQNLNAKIINSRHRFNDYLKLEEDSQKSA